MDVNDKVVHVSIVVEVFLLSVFPDEEGHHTDYKDSYFQDRKRIVLEGEIE